MSQRVDFQNHEAAMRYFTPELYLQLNSPDGKIVDAAMARWDKAAAVYRRTADRLLRERPSQVGVLAKLSLHDWSLVEINTTTEEAPPDGGNHSAFVMLKQRQNIAVLLYSLTKPMRLVEAPDGWSLSKAKVHWLYDELHPAADDREAILHTVLLSDGTTLMLPFRACRVWQIRAGTAISHSELMQLQTA